MLLKNAFILIRCLLLGLTLGFCPAFHPESQAAGVELHAHLFMKEGMTWFFRGEFNGPLLAKSWKDRFSSQANPETLDQSALDIVVVALYAHPLLTFSLRNSIREQIRLTEEFVKTHPHWVLAKSPPQAKKAIAEGKRVLILALEGASGILETEEDLQEFVDQKGIRIVTPLHLTNDHFGGVAFLGGLRNLASPLALLKSVFNSGNTGNPEAGVKLNPQGLTDAGFKFIQNLIQHHVWIDLAHSSDASQKEISSVLKTAHQPLLYTHTVLRKYHRAERSISMEQLAEVKKTGGYIGLMPSEEMLEGTLHRVTQPECEGSIAALSQQFREVLQILPLSSVAMGSDFNGGIPHLRPSCHTETELDQNGLWNIGQVPKVWQALERVGTFQPQSLNLTAMTQTFLETWERAWNAEI